MRTNGTKIAAEPEFEEEISGTQTMDHGQLLPAWDRTPSTKRAPAKTETETEIRHDDDFALAPLVDKIAFGIARGLVVAMKELEHHIASETRKVGDAVERRLDTLQISMQELSGFVGEQRSTNVVVRDQLESLRTEARQFSASLQESDVRQSSELEALRRETRASSISVSERIAGLCADLGVQQEDIAAVKTTLSTLSSRVDALVERLDRQADAVRLMHTNYSQRETELEQLVNGIAKLKAFPTPLPERGL
jgi:hypothetical protein